MTLLDVNILLYAYDQDAPSHRAAKQWVEELFSGPELIGLPWVTIWGFLRISTNIRLQQNPFTAEEALSIVEQWLIQKQVIVAEPGPRHAELLRRLMIECQVTGPLVTDTVLAALAIEHGATLASTDQDFSRFPELRWVNPLAGKPGS